MYAQIGQVENGALSKVDEKHSAAHYISRDWAGLEPTVITHQ